MRDDLSDITKEMLARVPSKEWLTTRDVIRIFRIHRVTVHKWVKKGILVRHRGHGRSNLYCRDDVVEFITSEYEPKMVD